MSGTLEEARAALTAPLGSEGSGRLRYGGAMALFNAGLIGVEVLEVYRICSPLDGEDPVPILERRGLRPPVAAPAPATILRALCEAAAAYLAGVDGPGVAEVRAGLATAVVAGPVTRPNAVVAAHLPVALAALDDSEPALAAAIEAARPHLGWITYDGYPRDEIGEGFARGHAFAPLAAGGDYELGLFLIAPGVLYRDHAHPAPELYAPLTGPTLWRFGPGTPLWRYEAHQPVWNDPHVPHMTKVGAMPLLCLYGWTRDINAPAYVIPAEDWPEIEAMEP